MESACIDLNVVRSLITRLREMVHKHDHMGAHEVARYRDMISDTHGPYPTGEDNLGVIVQSTFNTDVGTSAKHILLLLGRILCRTADPGLAGTGPFDAHTEVLQWNLGLLGFPYLAYLTYIPQLHTSFCIRYIAGS
jgi:hypothetical protein